MTESKRLARAKRLDLAAGFAAAFIALSLLAVVLSGLLWPGWLGELIDFLGG